MTSRLPRQWPEGRGRRAGELPRQGWRQRWPGRQIAALGVTQGTIRQRFSTLRRMQIVLWEHEPNTYESNMVHFVARDFAELMTLVFARTS